MKIDIPNKQITEFVLREIGIGALSDYLGGRRNLKKMVVEEALKKVEIFDWPMITSEEVKDRMLTILAERALEKDEE